jgi:outer membrane receptor protein involved in Fe transport
VIVSAQKRDQDILTVPTSVQALGGTTLQRQGITEITTALTKIPGASLQGQTNSSQTVYQLRGVANGDVLGDATVASYLDNFAFGVPTVPWAAPADLYDLNRLEVLQGPQGTLYGSSSLGGVIKVITNDPDTKHYDLSGFASGGSVDNHGYDYEGDLMVNLPLDDTFAVRAVIGAKHLTGDASAPFLGIQNANTSDVFSARIKALYQPTDKFRLLASYWYYNDHQDFTNRVDHSNPAQIDDRGVGNSPSKYWIGALDAQYDLGWANVLNSLGYMERQSSLLAVGCQVDTCFNVQAQDNTSSWSDELRLTSQGQGPLHWIGGFFFQHGSDSGPTFFNLTNPDLLTVSFAGVKSTEYAAFGEVSYDLWDGKIRPLVGLRYSKIDRSLSQDSNTTIETTPPILVKSTAGASGSFYHLTPRFNLSYVPNESGIVYLNIAQGFRPGALQSASEVASLKAVLGVDTPVQLNTDSLWSYEVGTKWRLFDNTMRVSAAVYAIDWKDAQFQTGASGVSGMINLGDVKGYGFELTISQRTPIPGLSWDFAGAINSTTIDGIAPGVLAALPFLSNGMQVPPVPKNNASIDVYYERPLPFADTQFISALSFYYRASEEDLSTGRRSAILQIWSAHAGIRRPTYEVQGFLDNFTNEQGPTIWEEGRMIVPRPRTIGIRVSWTPEAH